MNNLETLYARKFRLQAMINEAVANGEPQHKIERLEEQLETTEALIDKANIELYA